MGSLLISLKRPTSQKVSICLQLEKENKKKWSNNEQCLLQIITEFIFTKIESMVSNMEISDRILE